VRFYISAVLTSPEGYNLGTLCLIDTKPRPRPTDRELDRLRTLARIVVDELERLRLERVRGEQALLLGLAETMSGVAHWRYDIVTGEIHWSDLLYEIWGVDRRSSDPTLQAGLASFQPDDREMISGRLAEAIATKATTSFQARLIRPDGEARVVQSKAGCELDERGEVVALIGLFQDVTDQVRNLDELTASEARYRLLAENTSDVIVRGDLQGTLLYVSPACRAMGYEPEDLIGTAADRLLHPDDRERFNANSAPLLAGEEPDPSTTRQHRYLTADGRWVWFEGNPKLVRDAEGRAIEIVNVFRDVTERRELQERAERMARMTALAEEVVGIGYWWVDVATGEVNWSPHVATLYGLDPASEPRLDQFLAAMHPDDRPAQQARLKLAREQGLGWKLAVTRVVLPNGELRYLEGHGNCERDASGQVIAVFGAVIDITAKVTAEISRAEDEARYRLMAENTTDMIITADLSGRVTFVAASSRALLGYEPDEVIGRSALALAYPEDRLRVQRTYRNLTKGKSSERVRWRVPHKLAERDVWLESNPSLLRDPTTGTPTGFLDVIRDVTAQVAQEGALAAARAAAEAAATVKGEFMSTMSHEIRTPLPAVTGCSGLRAQRPDLDEVSQGSVQRVSSAGQALLAIVNDVLDFSKLEAGQVEISRRPASPLAVAQDALALFAPQADAKGLWLECQAEGDLPDRVMIDADRVRQVLLNLVGNAVKFTNDGAVKLFVGYDSDTAMLRIRIEDTGEGMSVEQQTKLFQRFSQVDASSTREHGGTGLGLAICKGLIEVMGGGIAVSSVAGEGTVFTFDVAAELASDLPAGLPSSALDANVRRLDGVRVLVVDDNFVNRELARTVLEQMGAEVAEADGGRAAIDAAAVEPFDCILMDLRMPGVSGTDALREIRDMPGPNQDVPVLAFTADADHGLVDLERGFDGLVCKPIMAADLIEVVDRFTRWVGVSDDIDLLDLAEA